MTGRRICEERRQRRREEGLAVMMGRGFNIKVEMSRARTLVQVVAGRKEGVPLARNTR
ncbi:hypothetical protein GALMADRAFT_260358 [Galerina marginata CBS 339.88]|uniref:Uncharacterized protein n=1 Tax=Galerina marginata (strain CBS 339.88) TaxID=685588 RepID=A0A067S2K5_GALM3|nr:hypothetical protein GALMADRAFT_260358 [Galerina marginata CBS 339.88]